MCFVGVHGYLFTDRFHQLCVLKPQGQGSCRGRPQAEGHLAAHNDVLELFQKVEVVVLCLLLPVSFFSVPC